MAKVDWVGVVIGVAFILLGAFSMPVGLIFIFIGALAVLDSVHYKGPGSAALRKAEKVANK